METWKQIEAAPDYAVSDCGRVRRITVDRCGREPRELAQAIGSAGRKQVSLCVDRKAKSHNVHRLVAIAFLGDPPSATSFVCHKDGNPLNNHVSNLYWGDVRTNGADAITHGTIAKGSRNGNSKLTAEKASRIKRDGRLLRVIAAEYGISQTTVSRIRRGAIWGHL